MLIINVNQYVTIMLGHMKLTLLNKHVCVLFQIQHCQWKFHCRQCCSWSIPHGLLQQQRSFTKFLYLLFRPFSTRQVQNIIIHERMCLRRIKSAKFFLSVAIIYTSNESQTGRSLIRVCLICKF